MRVADRDVRYSSLRPRPRSGTRRPDQRRGHRRLARPRGDRRSPRLSPLLVRRAPQHAVRGIHHSPGADRGRCHPHRASATRIRRSDAAQPRTPHRGGAVRRTRGHRARTHRPGTRPRAGERPGDHAAAPRFGHHERRRAVPPPCAGHRRAALARGGRTALHLGRRVHGARDARSDRIPRGVAAGFERLLRTARRLARAALRLREPLLGAGPRARARPVPHRIPSERGAPGAAHVPHRERGRRAHPRRKRRPVLFRSCG